MSSSPAALDALVIQFSRLPGIGPRTARRLSFFLLGAGRDQTVDLAEALMGLANAVDSCPTCFNFATTGAECDVCANPRRDRSTVCVVESAIDISALEKSGYRGLYHVLGGALDPMAGIDAEDLTIDELVERLEMTQPAIEEVIIATNATVCGDATAFHLSARLEPVDVKVTRLACGVPVGSDIEHVDEVTMGRALAARSACS